MCDARCKRLARGFLFRPANRRSSDICPAVLQRQSATENRVTLVMQSFALRNELSVSASPNPNGLTTPAATTATRSGFFSLVVLLNWAMKRQKLLRYFLLLS